MNKFWLLRCSAPHVLVPVYAFAFRLILRCLIVLFILSKARRKTRFHSVSLQTNESSKVHSCWGQLSDHFFCGGATSYKKLLLTYDECGHGRLRCVRRKQVLAALVCRFSHLKNFACDREGSFVFQKSKWIAHFASRFRKWFFFLQVA